MMLYNKYDKLQKNIHLDDQLRQKEGDEMRGRRTTERKLLQLVCVCVLCNPHARINTTTACFCNHGYLMFVHYYAADMLKLFRGGLSSVQNKD